MSAPFVFSLNDIQRIAACSLQQYFWQQSPPPSPPITDTILEAIRHLHASGGSARLSLPATLRYLEQHNPPGISTAEIIAAREIIAKYHRQLRLEWAQIVASNEPLSLQLSLPNGAIRCETTVHRLDKNNDGGITAIKLIPLAKPDVPLEADNIEVTALHALTAAAYPHRRPVRVAFRWLSADTTATLELTETVYRQNVQRLKMRLQAWLDGEILARPGLHCDTCPFKLNGCPLYSAATADQIEAADLDAATLPATLSPRNRTFSEGEQHDETTVEP